MILTDKVIVGPYNLYDVKIEPGAVVYENVLLDDGVIVGANAVIRPNTRILENTIIGTGTVIEGLCKIGRNTTVHAQCHITQGVTIGDNCFIAPFFIASNTPKITTGKHGRYADDKPQTLLTYIEDNVRIGICVSMTPGNTIGHHSLIWQNTLITKDIPSYSEVRGGKDQVGRIVGGWDVDGNYTKFGVWE